jgi:hypothetical protein
MNSEKKREIIVAATTMGALGATYAALGTKMAIDFAPRIGEYYSNLYNIPEIKNACIIAATTTTAATGSVFGTAQAWFWVNFGGWIYDTIRFEINDKKLENWKQDSIETASEMNLINSHEVDGLSEISLNVNRTKRPENMFYGFCDYKEKSVQVYHKNLSQKKKKIPKYLRKRGLPKEQTRQIGKLLEEIPKAEFYNIYNQSGMDHEIVGHLGNYFAGKDCSEKSAFSTQKQMAEYRGKEDINWRMASKFIPFVEKIHS